MESSEDDAGTATSASRRPSAREKDVGLAEDVDPTRNVQHESSEARVSCGTPAMSEDNFDGDSVPSPSAKDTSTEAILDMIDDFIDGPGASRRLPLKSQAAADLTCGRVTAPIQSVSISRGSQHSSEKQTNEITVPPQKPTLDASYNIENDSKSVHLQPAEVLCTPNSETLVCENTSKSVVSPQASSSVQVDITEQSSQRQEMERGVNADPSNTAESEGLSEGPVLDPPLKNVVSEALPEQPVPSSSEPVLLTEPPAISSLSSSVEQEVLTEQPVITLSTSCAEHELLTEQPVIASLSSSVQQKLLTEQSSTDPSSKSVKLKVITEQQPTIAPPTSSTEQEVPMEQSVSTPSTSSEPTVSRGEPAIMLPSSTVEPETLTEQLSLSNVAPGLSIEQSVISPPLDGNELGILLEPVIAPSSSSVEIVEVLLDTSECENVQRTIKCVTSSENKDNVTVELAESTSSECSVSESKPLSIEPVSRSPLKRRLIRPMVSERRPDSTVSSTVDSQTIDIHTTEQTSSEIITKDVSSSSDAVPHTHACTKPEEISNVSEISICKAETSTPPSRKIKLVRPKVTAVLSHCAKVETQSPVALEKDQCQSTSSYVISMPSCAESSVEDSSSRVYPLKSKEQGITSVRSDMAEKQSLLHISEQANEILVNETVEEKQQIIEISEGLEGSHETAVSAPNIVKVLAADTQSKEVKIQTAKNDDKISDEEKKLTPIKLNLPDPQLSESKMNSNSLELPNISSNLGNTQYKPRDDNSKLSQSVVQDVPEVPSIKSDQQNKQAEHASNSSHFDISKNDHKKVPPIKLNLSNADQNKNTELTHTIQKSKTVGEDSISHKLEESKQVPKLMIKLTNKHTEEVQSPVPKLTIKAVRPPVEQNTDNTDTNQTPSTTKITIKPLHKPTEKVNENLLNTDTFNNQLIPNVTKLNIKPIPRPSEKGSENVKPTPGSSEKNTDDTDNNQQIPSVTRLNIKPIPKRTEKGNESVIKPLRPTKEQNADDHEINKQIPSVTKINIKPIPKPIEKVSECKSKPLRSSTDQNTDNTENMQQIPSVTKINIKPILKPAEKVNDDLSMFHPETDRNDLQITNKNEHIPSVTKLNIKPIPKPAEKINEIHRKSSSSEISESEYSENDESTSTSDQASTSDQGRLDTVPKVTIKLGKPGTESEGKFYTEKNVPKLTIKNIQHSDKDDQDKFKLVVSHSDDKQLEKVPKITIKTVTKSDNQPISPKLTIKALKSPENVNKDNEIPKFKISTEIFSSSPEVKENQHVPKITIKPVTKPDGDGAKTPKKSTMMCDSSEHIPVVTKLNIKPILKPTESGESSESFDEKVPVVSKINIKPILKPNDSEVDSSIEDVPKITKLNIKPVKNPEDSSSEEKDCDEKNADMKDNSSIPVTKLNIKPIVKPVKEEALKDSENQSSETGNSSDDNVDNIPMVTKLNIKPIVKPSELEESANLVHNEQNIPVVTKLNIKPLVKPEDSSLSSPKKESVKSPVSASLPVVTKLNIKPIVKQDDIHDKTKDKNSTEKSSKNQPLVMKINMKNVTDNIPENEHICNNVSVKVHSPKLPKSPKATKRSTIKESNAEMSSKPKSSLIVETLINVDCNPSSPSLLQTGCQPVLENSSDNCPVPENIHKLVSNKSHSSTKAQSLSKPISPNEKMLERSVQETIVEPQVDHNTIKKNAIQISDPHETNRITEHYNRNCTKSPIQNYTLLKKLLSTTKEEKSQVAEPTNCLPRSDKSESSLSNCNDSSDKEVQPEPQVKLSPKLEKSKELKETSESIKMHLIQDVHIESNENVTKPLEIITDKITNQGSGQDSPRIILKIKTDHGASAKIISEEVHKPTDCSPVNESEASEHLEEPVSDLPSPKKLVNSRRKPTSDTSTNMTIGKRLRSSRIVESTEKSPAVKRNVNKRPLTIETSSLLQHKESEQSILETKKMKLEQLLCVNKSITITPVVSKTTDTSPIKPGNIALNQGRKISHNHSLLNNENCSQKNGNSKLHNILSNLQAKQMQTLQLNDTISEKTVEVTTEVESNTSTGSSDVVVEITRVENCHPEVQEMIINENSVCDLTETDEVSQDPLEVESTKQLQEDVKETASITTIELTPTPRKRGRPRKLPLPDGVKTPTPAPLPAPALEERPQRSLRLMRERPAILRKPRGGRGRGRGGRRPLASSPRVPKPEAESEPVPDPEPEPEREHEAVAVVEVVETRAPSPIDPTSSRIKLPRMTEALDKSVAGCATPLTSRRRSSAASSASSDLKLFSSAGVLDSPVKVEEFMKSPEATRPKSGRGSRGGRIRTPRNRGRGRGGGRGAVYMKETLGIYGRVCGPATTTVQLFEEETCMMDDNATPSKPSHLLDEDSQSSVKSSTNDSNKMKKSKFADLFDSNKVWTAADVKEYTWPPPDTPNVESQVVMIQEQVAMFLSVKSFKRRYPELKRRTVGGEEREYVLSKGVVSEALCDLGVTAVDASEVLDIMLSDYPHKYEEYRTYQRERQIASLSEETTESKPEERPIKVEVKVEKTSEKPEPPKVDPEKTRQDMAAAAIASAAEWNARVNACRRPACVDLQTMTVHRRRAPVARVEPARVRPPHGFYPHALLPGQFQHSYRAYTSEQLRYFPLNTVLAAPPAPPSPAESSSESEASWGGHSSSSDESDGPHLHSAKRKKLTRVKRSSQQDKDKEDSRGPEAEVDTCRVCKLRLEANRKYTHERFLVCANCNAKLHPGCVELPTDTIRKCREYPWQCAECKSCCACRLPQDDDKMLFCDLCDRGFHIYCVGLDTVPGGRWHCVECAICKSCGARDPNGLTPGVPSTPGSTSGLSTPGPSTPGPSTPGVSTGPGEWHHQTRRGPGGHKVYSHSLCTPCARAYRIGRYCPLCDRSFIGPKGTMQLVICKLCDRQLHQECVRATVSRLTVLDYTCAECRRSGITSRSAAVRAAPRTIATLFMAKRRFNKYAHRQYLQSRLAALQDVDPDASHEADCVEDPLEGAASTELPPPVIQPEDSGD